ncbi:MAG: hypothetical protein IIC32_02590 [Chloroflexi bacterium]|nr:hypothetical protein [Chloroflexota bacterium]
MNAQIRPAMSQRGGDLNAVLLFSVLVLVTLYQSELGLAGTIWNKLAASVAVFWIYRNFKLSFVHSVYIVPIFLAFVSLGVNFEAFSTSGLWSILATSISLALFALRPIALNSRLLRQLVVVYLFVILTISVALFAQSLGANEGPNLYFHVNRAASAWLFYQCSVLSLFFIESRTKWLIIIAFGLIIITTGSRGGIVAFGASLTLYSLLSHRDLFRSLMAIFKRLLALGAILVLGLFIAQRLIPEHLSNLVSRFRLAEGASALVSNRIEVWDAALSVWLETDLSTLLGAGPSAFALVGTGAHNSYLEAAALHGVVFVLISLFVLFLWNRSLVRRGHTVILALTIPLLIYGATDSFLFTGMRQLWYLLAFLGIYLHSQSSRAQAAGTYRTRSKPFVALQHGSGHAATRA